MTYGDNQHMTVQYHFSRDLIERRCTGTLLRTESRRIEAPRIGLGSAESAVDSRLADLPLGGIAFVRHDGFVLAVEVRALVGPGQ